MNAGEANVLLTKAALVDRWMKFGTPQELAAAANEWAIVLALPLFGALLATVAARLTILFALRNTL